MAIVTGPYRLTEEAEAEACAVLDHLNKLAGYAEQHPSVPLAIARTLFQTAYGQRVLARFHTATGLTLKIDTTEETP